MTTRKCFLLFVIFTVLFYAALAWAAFMSPEYKAAKRMNADEFIVLCAMILLRMKM